MAARSGSVAKKLSRPHVTVHTLSSVDGRILTASWNLPGSSKYFEIPAEKIKADAWIVGRVTMEEIAHSKGKKPRKGQFQVPPGDFVAKKNKTYAVGIDPSGKCRWTSGMTSTEHVIMALTEEAPAEHLDHLRSVGVSYVLCGKKKLDLALVLHKLRTLFGIERARVDGGGHVNGSFLKAGLADEFSVVFAPLADGRSKTLASVEMGDAGSRHPAVHFRLKSVKKIFGDFLWARYDVVHARR
ncbi:MAG: dihydrofolate reductase family protein [Polyangiaceae bacterium]